MNEVSISVALWAAKSLERPVVIDEYAAYIMDEQGYLYLSGRKHAVINRSVFHIIPEKAERMLQEVSGVESVVVVGREHPERGQEPHAFVRLHEQEREEANNGEEAKIACALRKPSSPLQSSCSGLVREGDSSEFRRKCRPPGIGAEVCSAGSRFVRIMEGCL